jgi:hypothetical protein
MERTEAGQKSARVSNNMLGLIIVFLLISVFFFNYRIYENIQNENSVIRIQGSAVGIVRVCINTPPSIGNSCPAYANVSYGYYCNINATDADGHNISYYDNSSLYNITSNGTISFVPLQSQIGTEISKVIADDNTLCSNSNATAAINITVCMQPLWNNFRNNATTNLSLYPCWNSIKDFRIGKPGQVTANFSGSAAIDGYDFDTYLNISDNYLNINIGNLTSLHRDATLVFYNIIFGNLTITRNGLQCPATECVLVSSTNGTVTVNVTSLNGTYYLSEQAALSIYDDTDTYIRYVNESVGFYANLSFSSGLPLTTSNCTAAFNISNSFTSPAQMVFNSTLGVYVYNRSFRTPGNYTWKVNCTSSYTLLDSDQAVITNRKPVLIANMPNETWNQNTVLTGRDLDDYFADPDGDNLTFTHTSVPGISVYIDPETHVITLTPDPTFYGNTSIIYYGTDPFGETAQSNVVLLTVIEVPGAAPAPTTAPSAGGGGGAGAYSAGIGTPACKEVWVCGEWGPCLPSGIQTRNCYQNNTDCNTNYLKPNISQPCEYVPTCYDSIKNGYELGVDCGGVCPPCPTCNDGIQNQGEEGIDCGGPCKRCPTCSDGIMNDGETGIDCGGPCRPCPTCSDGIQNQGEEGIDCGGPCQACRPVEAAGPKATNYLLLLLLLLLLLAAAYTYRRRKELKQKLAKFLLLLAPYLRKMRGEKVTYEDIVVEMLKEIWTVEQKIGKVPPVVLFEKLYTTIMGFFSKALDINYQASHMEIIAELTRQIGNRKLARIMGSFIAHMEKLKFSKSTIDDNKLREICRYARKVVGVIEHTAAEGLYPREILPLMEKTEFLLESDSLRKARSHYVKLLQKYGDLDAEEKKKYYKRIMQLGVELNKKIERSNQLMREGMESTETAAEEGPENESEESEN